MTPITAFVHSPIQAMSIQRIVQAIRRYAPADVTLVERADQADLVVHLVVGVQNFAPVPIDQLIADGEARGQRHAIVQCCVASTEQPTPAFWAPLWQKAVAVWSYLDLARFAPGVDFPFYYAPLGADRAVFNRARLVSRDITLITTGYVAESEGVREASAAVRRVGGWHVHVGPDFKLGDHVTTVHGLSDDALAGLYARAQYVAGLRRCEGFELPAAEGLLCGARPICFDAPHYRQWFGRWAKFVPEEDDPAVVADAITQVLAPDGAAVSLQESGDAADAFNWAAIVGGFWRKALGQPVHAAAEIVHLDEILADAGEVRR